MVGPVPINQACDKLAVEYKHFKVSVSLSMNISNISNELLIIIK